MDHHKAGLSLRDAFLQFARNGCWGTCGACPRDSVGMAYPEFCANFGRYDHQLTIDQLAEAHKNEARASGA